MFVVLLRFADNKSSASEFMDAHKAWLQQGFADGVFMVAGGLQPNAGGAIIAHGVSHDELMARVAADPFVTHNVVAAEVLEITPSRTDERLSFLKDV